MPISPPTASFAYPALTIAAEKLIALTESLRKAGFRYGFGCKITPISLQASETEVNRRRVDCSGFVRWAVFHACGGLTIPDGSSNQHDWFEKQGFKHSTAEDCLKKDGAIRIAFLSPHDTPSGIGHVLFILNGKTFESHGGVGPDSRDFALKGWMTKVSVYVVTAPVAA